MKRVICSILALCLAFSMVGCGKGGDESVPSQGGHGPEDDMGLAAVVADREGMVDAASLSQQIVTPQYAAVSIPETGGPWVQQSLYSYGGQVYYLASLEEEYQVWRIDPETGTQEKLAGHSDLAFLDLAMDQGGNIYISAYQIADDSQSLILCLSSTGQELWRRDTTSLLDEDFARSLECVDDKLYIMTSAQLLAVKANEDLSKAASRDISQAILSRTGEGQILLGYTDERSGNYVVEYADKESLKTEESFSFNIPFNSVSGSHGRDFFLTTGSSAFLFHHESSSLEKLFTWSGIGMGSGVLAEAGEKLVTTSSIDTFKSNPPIVLAKTNIQPGDMSVIRLANTDPTGPNYIVKEAIADWNALNPQHPIEVVDYSAYISAENTQAAALKLGTDIINGHMPDMFDFSLSTIDSLPSSAQFARRGLLEDLYPYIDLDPELSREDFIPGIMEGMEIDGGLYELAPVVSLMTTFARTSALGEDFSYAGLSQAAASSDQYELIYAPAYDRGWLLGNILCASSSLLIDWDNCQCHFDSDYFRGVLMSLRDHPDEAVSLSTLNYAQAIADSKGLLYPAIVNELYFATNGLAAFGPKDYCFPGFPELGSAVYPTCSLSISAYSQNKDICWKFMRQFLLKENSQDYYMSPRKDCIDVGIQRSVDFLNQSGLGQFVQERTAAMEAFKPLLLDTTNVYRFDGQIWDIVWSEAYPYFTGDKSLDQAIAQIQSRASIYMAEQYG